MHAGSMRRRRRIREFFRDEAAEVRFEMAVEKSG